MEIKKEYCGTESEGRKQVLPGEIAGVETKFINASREHPFHFVPTDKSISIFLPVKGKGSIIQGNRRLEINEPSVFVPADDEAFFCSTGKENLWVLQVSMVLSKEDLQLVEKQRDCLPYFVSMSGCRQYTEAIKSEKTVNRTLLPENIVPRLCIGSVTTSGPDEVAEHSHPMLEQLFFGLTDNHCLVSADGHSTLFEEGFLLRIPGGSVHGVKVEQNKILNYIWIDVFKTQEDMKYISEKHIPK